MKVLRVFICCLAACVSVAVYAQPAGPSVYPSAPALGDTSIYTNMGISNNWEFGIFGYYIAGGLGGNPSGSKSNSGPISWVAQYDWYGTSSSTPTATGDLTTGAEYGASASASSEATCSSSASGSAGSISESESATGAQGNDSGLVWDGGTDFDVSGSSMVFVLVGSGHYQATNTFSSSTLYGYGAASAPTPCRNNASGTGVGYSMSFGSWGVVSSTIVVTGN